MTENKKNRFVRPNLQATRDGVVDPKSLVELWLDRLEDILRVVDGGGEVGAQEAFDLLACVGKLERARPELVIEAGDEGEFARAKAILAEQGKELAKLAVSVLNPEAWLEDAKGLEAWLDADSTTEEEAVSRTTDMFDDLADVAVAREVAWKICHGITELEWATISERMDPCFEWLEDDNWILFLDASCFIQSLGATIRADIYENLSPLCFTTGIIEDFLDVAEDAENDMAGRNIKSMPPEVVKRLWEEFLTR